MSPVAAGRVRRRREQTSLTGA
uniref:Uncharacterized protein n=1 Tax=Arundo donax TaxID=35708 RepID=A0A0A8ZTF2_ARUDO